MWAHIELGRILVQHTEMPKVIYSEVKKKARDPINVNYLE